MAEKKKKIKRHGPNKGILTGAKLSAASGFLTALSIGTSRTIPIVSQGRMVGAIPRSKTGMALFGAAGALQLAGIGTTVKGISEKKTFRGKVGAGVVGFLQHKVANRIGFLSGNALAIQLSSKKSISLATKLNKKTKAGALKRRVRRAKPVGNPQTTPTRFIRIRGRVVPIRGKKRG